MPSYQALSQRLNNLAPAFELLIDSVVQAAHSQFAPTADRVIDNVLVVLARAARATGARVARDVADQSFCASKTLWYHGVKIHLQAVRCFGHLPLPERLLVTEASCHDLTALRQMEIKMGNCVLFADKAYADTTIRAKFGRPGTTLVTLNKKEKNQPLAHTDSLWSRFVSSMRQPIESLFNWIIEQTGIQNASQVRSTSGLLVHCYGKLAVACVLLVLYP